jgi:Ser/Thr protein kinase RdoA (MazF antagonist)
MTSEIKARFNEACLHDILGRYGLEARHQLLSDWHAFTFEVYRGNEPFILRISDDSHRTKEDIEGELEWMAFVQKGGVQVPSVMVSNSGQKNCEVLQAGASTFTAVLFEKLNGRVVSQEDWNEKLFERWGALVGRLHRLSPQFQPVKPRKLWHESDFLNIEAYIPDELAEIKRAARTLLDTIKALPRNAFTFGHMHADVYQDNFFIAEDGLQLFDFDNTEQGFFVNDLAISLYAALWRLGPEEDRQIFTNLFLKSFLAGYSTEFTLAKSQLETLPLFLRLRDLLIYVVMRKKRDLNHLTPRQAQLLKERGQRIMEGIPIVEVEGILHGV